MTDIRELLRDLLTGKISIEEAEKLLRIKTLHEIGSIAMIDVNRQNRSGIPEVVFAESKDSADIVSIVKGILEIKNAVMITRLTDDKLDVLKDSFEKTKIDAFGRSPIITALAYSSNWTPPEMDGKIAVMTAGTSDISYAKEAEALAGLMGVEVLSFYDVGVSGIHRLIEPLKEVISKDVDAIIVFAGMEGALPTVVASLVDIPVIGVPVPTGYGFGGRGETALASMLQSCSPGLAVVNIGNGLGAASIACLITKRASKRNK